MLVVAGGRWAGWVGSFWWVGGGEGGNLGFLGILVFVLISLLVWCIGGAQLVQVAQAVQVVHVVQVVQDCKITNFRLPHPPWRHSTKTGKAVRAIFPPWNDQVCVPS